MYPHEPKLCVINHLTYYLQKTKHLRSETTKLFISFIKPHKAVSKDTISRWCKTTLQNSGINTAHALLDLPHLQSQNSRVYQ